MISCRLGLFVALLACAGTLAGCGSSSGDSTSDGSGSGGGGGGEPAALPATVEDSLNLLGVPTADSARLSNEGLPLPETFSPFGQRIKASVNAEGETHIGAPLEIAIGGFSLAGSTSSFVVLDNPEVPGSGGAISPQPIYARSDVEAPWAREDDEFEQAPPVTLRDATAGDIDGDGYDELVVIFSQAGQVFARISNLADPATPEAVFLVPVPVDVFPVGDVRVVTADFDQDGRVEVVAGISQAAAPGRTTRSVLLVLEPVAGIMVARHSRSFQSTLPVQNVHVTMVLEAGSVDYDTAEELVVVLNEFFGSQEIAAQAATRFFLLDDTAHDFAELLADTLAVVTSSATYQAQVADVAIGDIDQDMIGEIVFGGLADLSVARSCNTDGNGNIGSLRYLLLAYEFTGTGFHKSRTAFSSDTDASILYPGYCANQAATWAIRFMKVNVLDFNNDGDADIQANQFIFTGIPEHGWKWGQRADFILPEGVLMPDENTDLAFDRHSAQMIVSDVDGNGRDDIISYRAGDDRIRIYSWRQDLNGEGQEEPPELFQLAFMNVNTTDPDRGVIPGIRLNPILLAFDADGRNEGDVQTLEFVGHRFVLTEPLVLAALAAPPCQLNIGQNTDACTTSWGTARVSGTEAEREVTFKAGITIGFEAEYQAGAGFVVDASTKVFGLAIKGSFSEALAEARSESYEVTRSVSFETGPMEDSVVFASIPYDFYDYEVIASTRVNMDDIGAEREVQQFGLPRTPIIRMAEAGYYNAHTTATAVKIDSSVFDHVADRLDSYPDRARRDDILSGRRTQLDDIRSLCPGCWQVDPRAPILSGNNPYRQFDPRDALEGLMSETVGVGQGAGATEVAIDFSRSTTDTTALEKSGELDVEMTTGYLVTGFTLERSVNTSTSTSVGSSTSYVGTVGSIDAENFASRQYRFGMFTYLQGHPETGQEFEVINYWVE